MTQSLLVLCLLVSCHEEEIMKINPPLALITFGKWTLFVHGVDVDNSNTLDSCEDLIDDCQRDNTYSFFIDGTDLRGILAFALFFFLSSYLPLCYSEWLPSAQLIDLTEMNAIVASLLGLLVYHSWAFMRGIGACIGARYCGVPFIKCITVQNGWTRLALSTSARWI